MKFKVREWSSQGHFAICCEKPKYNTYFIWKDGTVHHNSTGWAKAEQDFDKTAGFWATQKEAEIFLAGWLLLKRDFQGLYNLEREIATPKKDKGFFWIQTSNINIGRVDKEQQYPLGMRYKDIYGMTWTYYHKPKTEIKETKMTKELTVAEISKALGYEVKVVKEQPHYIPRSVYVGQIYEVAGDKYMVAALGRKGTGLTSVGGCAGCWSSNLIDGPIDKDKIRTRLIELRAKYLGTFGFVFKTTK